MAAEIDTNAAQIIQLFRSKFPEVFDREMQRATIQALLSMIGPFSDYPERPSSYRRTGTLGRAWVAAVPSFTASTGGFEGSLGNNTEYGPFVQSATQQAAIHAPFWNTDEAIIEAQEGQIVQFYVQAVERLADDVE